MNNQTGRAAAPGNGTATRRESPHKGKTGLRRVVNAFLYSLSGLNAALKHEDAFRQEVILAAFLIPGAFLLTHDNLARALMIGSVLLVLVVELINSAIEATVDRISLKDHELAKRAKDIGSASVFIAMMNVIVMWGLALSM
ncbi:MAG TPA: diacylglycerol kinase [Thiobacillaceae bacterium]|nr:diacylglycerol kinase [Thiobacillaceae bacterium]